MKQLFFFKFIYSLLPGAFILCCFGHKKIKKINRISDFEATIWRVFPRKWQPLINIRWLKNEQTNVCFFTVEFPCPYFSLNLRHIVMSHIHCEMHNKLSKTRGVTIGVYGINNYFTVPYTESTSNILLLDKLIFLRFLVPLPLPEEENMQSE